MSTENRETSRNHSCIVCFTILYHLLFYHFIPIHPTTLSLAYQASSALEHHRQAPTETRRDQACRASPTRWRPSHRSCRPHRRRMGSLGDAVEIRLRCLQTAEHHGDGAGDIPPVLLRQQHALVWRECECSAECQYRCAARLDHGYRVGYLI
jgi:hypothetical protein